MKMRHFIWVLLALIAISAVYVYIFVYNKAQPAYEKLPADYELQAEELFEAYRSGKSGSDSLYTGKMIQIAGIPSKIEKVDSLVIVVFEFSQGMFGPEGIRCTLLQKHNLDANGWKAGGEMLVKGFCTGYNDTDVILEKCILIKGLK